MSLTLRPCSINVKVSPQNASILAISTFTRLINDIDALRLSVAQLQDTVEIVNLTETGEDI